MSSTQQPASQAWSVLRDLEPELASAACREWLRTDPMAATLDAVGRRCLVDDARRHLSHLSQSIRVENPAVFVEYVDWARSLLEAIGVPSSAFGHQLERLAEAIDDQAAPIADHVRPTLQQGLAVLGRSSAEPPSPLLDSSFPEFALAVTDLLVAGDREAVLGLVREVLDEGMELADLYLEVLQPSLREVGRRWQLRHITVAEEHLATAGAQYLLSTLYPQVFGESFGNRGRRLLATCVGGNMHELGIRMVADLFALDGWTTDYLGASVPTRDVVDFAVKRKADVVAISATMIDHLPEVEELIQMLRKQTNAVILVGGRPFLTSPELAAALGADGTALDARDAIVVANNLVAA